MTKNYLRGKIQLKKAGDIVTVVASDESLDRHGDVLPIEQWDLTKFMLSPRMLVDHDHQVSSIVGKWKNVRIEGNQLLMDADFHGITELSRAVKEMVLTDYLDTVSVGFIYHGAEKDGGKPSFELIETSWVTVPANPNARIQLSLKSAMEKDLSDEEKAKVKDFIGDEKDEDESIIPDTDEDIEDPIEVDGDDLTVLSIEDFNKLSADTVKVSCDYQFLKGLIADSEKLQTLTNADKAQVGEALRTAKIMKIAFKEASHIVNDALMRLNKNK